MAKNYNYTYRIRISFNKAQCACKLGRWNIAYYKSGANVKYDIVIFHKKKIEILARRKDYYTASDILNKAALALHSVIERALMLYYANCSNFPLINHITISANCTNTSLNYEESTNKMTTPQMFKDATSRNVSYVVKPTSSWSNLDKKSNALRISLSYWLEAIATTAPQIKFERAWTAFNTLYTFYGRSVRESDNHSYIKGQIRNNQAHFNQTIAIASSMSVTTLRSYRWKMWSFNHIERKSLGLLKNIMINIDDSRLKQVFWGVFNSSDICRKFSDTTDPVRNTNLQTELSQIKASLATPGITDNMQVALFLCVNYAYFLRNRRFHGGSENSYCKISPSAEDVEFENIANRLIVLVKELYDAENVIMIKP